MNDPLFGADCQAVSCYLAFQSFDLFGGPFPYDALLTRPLGGAPANQQGAQTARIDLPLPGGKGWIEVQKPAQSPKDPAAGPFSSQSGWPDCVPGDTNTECFDQSPSYYETLQAADIDGTGGDELLGRLDDGLRVKSLRAADDPVTHDDPGLDYAFAVDTRHERARSDRRDGVVDEPGDRELPRRPLGQHHPGDRSGGTRSREVHADHRSRSPAT